MLVRQHEGPIVQAARDWESGTQLAHGKTNQGMQGPRTHPAPDHHYRTAIGKALAIQACSKQFNWYAELRAVEQLSC